MNTTEQQIEEYVEAQREQRFFNGIVKSAEFWASVENMTPEAVISFHQNELKNHIKNREITIYMKTKIKHNKAILEIEGILELLK